MEIEQRKRILGKKTEDDGRAKNERKINILYE